MNPSFYDVNGRISWFNGDGSERCLVCRWRSPADSYYVGQTGMTSSEGLPERFPVCSEEHGLMWMKTILVGGLDEGLAAYEDTLERY